MMFNEELGMVVEVGNAKVNEVMEASKAADVPVSVIAKTQVANHVTVNYKWYWTRTRRSCTMCGRTSFEMDKLHTNPTCSEQEQEGLKKRHKPTWKLTYEPCATPAEWVANVSKNCMTIIREEGFNDYREMTAAMYTAGFEP